MIINEKNDLNVSHLKFIILLVAIIEFIQINDAAMLFINYLLIIVNSFI